MGEADDPARIRSLAVSSEDVANAFVYSRENPGTAVLRVTADEPAPAQGDDSQAAE